MMTHSKKYLFRLILLAAFLVPLSIDKGQSMNLNLGSTHLNFKQSSFSSKKTIAHPRKKTKKKHKTILDHKHKMRNGHSCPSF